MIESHLRVDFFYQDREISPVSNSPAARLGSLDGVSHTGSSDAVGTDAGTFSLTEHTQPHYYEDVYVDGYLSLRVRCMRLLQETNHELLADFFRLSTAIYRLTDPQYACGLHSYQIESLGQYTPFPISEDAFAANCIERPMWVMVFPPPMVAEYSRDWLLSLPVERVDELDDGAIVTIATTDFFDADSSTDPDAEVANRIERAIGPLEDAFAEKH